MLPFNTRFVAASFVASLSLASCGPGGTSSQMTPLQSVQRSPQAKNNDAHCKTLPLINQRGLMLDARSRETAARSNCSVRSFHKMVARGHSGNIQVFDVPGAIDESNCAPSQLFGDCGTFANAINAAGTIVGLYVNTDNVIASFIRTSDAKYTSFQVGSDEPTEAYDITNSGASAGQYFDTQSISHAFI